MVQHATSADPPPHILFLVVINVETDLGVSCGSYNSSVTAKVNFKEITTSCTFIPKVVPDTTCYAT
jgi:hypothetical protein